MAPFDETDNSWKLVSLMDSVVDPLRHDPWSGRVSENAGPAERTGLCPISRWHGPGSVPFRLAPGPAHPLPSSGGVAGKFPLSQLCAQ